jgi:DNA-binding MarR family transcriptional regulator
LSEILKTAPATIAESADRSPVIDDIRRMVDVLFRLGSSRRVYAQQTRASGFSMSRSAFILLQRVQANGPLSMGELARLAHMDAGATARKISQLEREGYITRCSSTTDGRVILVRTTPQGRAVAQRIAKTLKNHMSEALDEWSDCDLQTFSTLLERFLSDLRSTQFQNPDDGN